MTIWDDLKPYWQLAGSALAKRSYVNAIDARSSGQAGPILSLDGPGRVDLTLPETSPLYIFSTVAAPTSAVGAGNDLWLAPYGQLADIAAILTPVATRQVLSDLTFHIVSTPLATDTVQIDLCRAPLGSSGATPTGLTLTVPANTSSASFLAATTLPVIFEIGDSLALRLRQSGSAVQAAWNAYICIG